MSRRLPTEALFPVAVATFSALLLVLVPQALAKPPTESVFLQLPPNVYIQLASGDVISGVRRLMAVNSSGIRYEKVGLRFLPASKVKKITFQGRMKIYGPDNIILADVQIGPDLFTTAPLRFEDWFETKPPLPLSCQKNIQEMLVDVSAVTIQSDGARLRLPLLQEPKTRKGSAFILHQLSFEKNRSLRIRYSACYPTI